MKKRLSLTSIAIAILTACGGGGGAGSVGPVSDTAQSPAVQDGYYREVIGAIPDLKYVYDSLGGSAMVLDPQSIDMNGDGLDDIVLHFATSAAVASGNGASGQNLGNTPMSDRVVILIQQPDGTFLDKTSSIIVGTPSFGGGGGGGRIIDLNGDGKLDIAYVANQEDGRNQAVISDNFSQDVVLMSNVDGTYSFKKFGPRAWNSNVAVGYMNGQAFVTRADLAGTGIETGGYVSDLSGNISRSTFTLPQIGANATEFYTNSTTSKDATYFIETGISSRGFGLDGYKYDGAGTWSKLNSLPSLVNEVATVPFLSYSGNLTSASVVEYNGRYALGIGSGSAINDSCQLRLTPTSDKTLIFSGGLMYLTNYVLGQTTTISSNQSVVGGLMLFGAKVVGNSIQQVPLNIDNLHSYDLNVSATACMDVNQDGYDDIVVYSYNNGGKPDVYLNNKSGGFTYTDLSKFPQGPSNWGSSARSLLHKFSKSGYSDLLILPSNGLTVGNGADSTFKFFKAIAPLK